MSTVPFPLGPAASPLPDRPSADPDNQPVPQTPSSAVLTWTDQGDLHIQPLHAQLSPLDALDLLKLGRRLIKLGGQALHQGRSPQTSPAVGVVKLVGIQLQFLI